MTTVDRIQELLTYRGIQKRGMRRALERTCGISYQAVSQWFTGETNNIKNEHLAAIAHEYGSTIDWLVSGIGPMTKDQEELPDITTNGENHTQYGVEIASEWTTAKVAVMDQRFSAGQGAHEEHMEDFVSGYEEISQALLEKEQILPGHARIIKIDGDSMYPTLWDKDEVLSDTHVPHLVSDSIYAFEFDGRLLVKRFTKKLDGSWLISSDNKDDPSLKDEIVSHHNAQQLRIIARCKRVIGRSI